MTFAECRVPSLTAQMVSDVVEKNEARGQGNNVSESELRALLRGRSTLNVSSAHKYDDYLGIDTSEQLDFSRFMRDVDESCSTPNGHFRTSLLFDALDVNNSGRINANDVRILGDVDNNDNDNDNDNNNDNDGDSDNNADNGADVFHVGTTSAFNKGDLRIRTHENTQQGDLLILIVHRTDGPVIKDSFDGWKFLVKCEKHPTNFGNNSVDCDHNGRNTDLGQTILFREASRNGVRTYDIDMSGSKPAWAFLTTLRNADISDPMRDADTRGDDGTRASRFPSVEGRVGDMLLMSQSFDDQTSTSRFQAPEGSQRFGFIRDSDETGFLFGKVLSENGDTGNQTTRGSGAASSKDALISITIRRKN